MMANARPESRDPRRPSLIEDGQDDKGGALRGCDAGTSIYFCCNLLAKTLEPTRLDATSGEVELSDELQMEATGAATSVDLSWNRPTK